MNNNVFKTIQIVYFSGTGGTKRIADEFESQLIERDCNVTKISLDYQEKKNINKDRSNISESVNLVILLFPVHAVDAPKPIYDWIHSMDKIHKKIVVISVSGGGEVWPNTGCRANCCKALEDKGFDIIYDKMMVMPSNWTIKINDHLAMWLIKVIPHKVNEILSNIFCGKIVRTNLTKGVFGSYLSKLEKKGAYKFAKRLKIESQCVGCGWCERNCPVGNIEIVDKKPKFRDKCIMCFRCVYGCPSHGIKSNNFMVLKTGFNLEELEKRMKEVELEPIKKCSKGLLMIGIRKYLMEGEYFVL